MIKIIVQEQKRRFTNDPVDDETTYWETMHEITVTGEKIAAGTLRAIADSYDPKDNR